MAWTGDPVWLERVLRDAGLSVSIYNGSVDRGHGNMGTLWGTMLHHTGAPVGSNPGPGAIANHPSLGLAAQLHLSRAGHWTVCGIGIAYHAGAGSYPGLPTNNANPIVVGVEAENSGTEGWSPEQYWSYVRGVAAINREMGRDHTRAIGHKEWAAVQGKWDPGGMNLDKFRSDVREILAGPDAPPVRNEIDHTASFSGWLGQRLHTGERPCADGVGRYADFEHGSIYWHPDTGSLPVPTLVYEVWANQKWEQGPLGYPTRYHVVHEGQGDVQEFQGGTVARRYGKSGYTVYGAIGARWREEGDVRGPLGYPTSFEYSTPDGGRRQDFEHDSLVWHPSGAPKILGGK